MGSLSFEAKECYFRYVLHIPRNFLIKCLADTKYEFGKTKDGQIVLMDEFHTRYVAA